MLAKTFQALQRRSSRFRRGHSCGVCVWLDRRVRDRRRQRCGSIRIRYRAAPCRPTRALCRHHTSIFLPRTASGRSACTLAAKLSNASRACGSDFGRAHRKAPKPERGKLPACRAFLHLHTQAPFNLALQTDTPPADNTVRFRTGACADERGKRGLTRRVEEWVTPRRPASPSSL